MKKILITFITLSTVCGFSQNVIFNDANLKQKIVSHGQNIIGGVTGINISLIDTDLNGEISIAEAQAYTGRLYLNQNGSDFYTDLTGAEEFINITELFCENNQMTTLDVSSNTQLTGLYCENNQISTLNLSNNSNLTVLNFRYNSISSINLANNTSLITLNCENNSLNGLNLSAQTSLTWLTCNDNAIISLDLSDCVNLENVMADNNNISTLTLPNSNSLEQISANSNSIENLDVSTLPYLSNLYIDNNLIESLDFTNIDYLNKLSFNNNNVDSLDLTGNIYVESLNCTNNVLTFLDFANGNNTFVNIFNTTDNPNLTCIKVDDVAYSTTNWTSIDAQTSFNINCPNLVSSIEVVGQNSVSVITTDGGTLQILATVLPVNATDNTYSWSVINGSGAGTIDNNGLLTATNNGTVTVKATANDASGVTASTIITISNQTTASINDNSEIAISVYPNPSSGIININTENHIQTVEILNISGQKVYESKQSINDVSHLKPGLYIIKISTDLYSTVKQIIID